MPTKLLTLLLLLGCSSVSAQVKFQAHYGSRIGNYYSGFTQVNDSVSIRMEQNSIPRDVFSLFIEFKLFEKTHIRGGIGYMNGYQFIAVSKANPDNFPAVAGSSIRYKEFNILSDIQVGLTKNLYGIGGFKLDLRSNTKVPLFGTSHVEEGIWSDDEVADIKSGLDAFRSTGFGYRYGIGYKPFRRVGAELIVSQQLINPFRTPITIYERNIEPNFRYRVITFDFIYFFQIGKKDE